MIAKFPVEGRSFSKTFADLQETRHGADYDPLAQSNGLDVSTDLAAVEAAMTEFRSAPTKHRRAFSAYILFKDRND